MVFAFDPGLLRVLFRVAAAQLRADLILLASPAGGDLLQRDPGAADHLDVRL